MNMLMSVIIRNTIELLIKTTAILCISNYSIRKYKALKGDKVHK